MINYVKTRSEADFTRSGAQALKESIQDSIRKRGKCMLGLSGGSTPRPIYEAMGKEEIDWSKVTIFLVDERYIEANDEKSNQNMVRETLLKSASIPEENIIFPDTGLPLDECVKNYAVRFKKMIDEQGYLPDVVTLGLGEDGHIASLFPPVSDEALSDKHFVLYTQTYELDVKDRITLALNVIAAAQNHIFFLKGASKKHVWDEMMASDEDEKRWPAKRVLQSGGTTVITLW